MCCNKADWVHALGPCYFSSFWLVAGLAFVSESLCCMSPVCWTRIYTSWSDATGLFCTVNEYLAGQEGNVQPAFIDKYGAFSFLLQGALIC